jgi:hypothetical protein
VGVRINVWYPAGANVGHASIEIDHVYMSWWPDASANKLKMLLEVFAGGPGQAPTYQDDRLMEGNKDPDWYGEYFGWDRDDEAVALWRRIYFSDLQKGLSAARSGQKGANYNFVTNNCCDVVDQMLEKAGAYDYKIKLNLWRGVKGKLAPKDIATIGCYLGGQTSILDHPKMWSPIPEVWS